MRKTTLLALSVSTMLLAQDSDVGKKELDSISVVGQSQSVVDLQNATKTQPKNITEVLQQNTSINMGGGSANTQRIYLRGVGEGLINVTIDGAKQSKELHNHRGGTASIDTEILKAVSINAGVSPADNGAGNLGGSISFETVDAQDLLGDRSYGAYIKTMLGSVDDSYKNSIALYAKAHENIGLLVYGNKSDSKNYKTGSGREVLASAEEVENYLIKMSMIDLDSHTLKVSHEKNTQEGLYKWGSTGSDMGYLSDENEAVPQRVTRKTSILNYGFNPNDLVDIGVKLYQNDEDLENLSSNSKYSGKTKGADFRNSFVFGVDNLKNRLTIGVDYEDNEGKEKDGFREVKDKNLGFYLQNRLTIDSLNLSFGARYDDFEQTIAGRKFSDSKISPNINAEYFITDNFSLFAGWGKAANSSNLVPIGWLTGSGVVSYNGSVDGDLKAQTSEKYEVGTSFGFNNLTGNSDSLSFKFTLFDTTIKNSIARAGGGSGNLPVNLWNGKDIESKGIEARVGYELENFRASLGYTHSKIKQDGTEIAGTVKRTASSYGDRVSANFDYDVSSGLGFGYQILAQLKNRHPSSANVNNKAGYAVHNFSASFTPQEFKDFTISLAVNNAFNKDYSSHSSLSSGGEAVGEAGRDVRVALKYTF